MKKIAPTSSAAAIPDVPDVNCGVVSCTYPIETRAETVEAVRAADYAVQGTPQPQECSL